MKSEGIIQNISYQIILCGSPVNNLVLHCGEPHYVYLGTLRLIEPK